MGELRSARASRPGADGDKDDHTKVMLMLNSTAWEKRLEEARVQRKMVLAAKASRGVAAQDGSAPSLDDELNNIKETLFVARESKETGKADSSNGASGQQQIRDSGNASLSVVSDRLRSVGLDQLRVVEPQLAHTPQIEEIDVSAKSSANIDKLAAAMSRARTPNSANSAELNDTDAAETNAAELPVTPQRTIVRPAMVVGGFALGLILGLAVAVLPQYLRSPGVAESANGDIPAAPIPQASRSDVASSPPTERELVEGYSNSAPVTSDTIESPEATGTAKVSAGLTAMPTEAPGEPSLPLRTSAASLSVSVAPVDSGFMDHELPVRPSLLASAVEPQAPDFDMAELKLRASGFDPSPEKTLSARLNSENSLALVTPLVPTISPNRALGMVNGYQDSIAALAVPVVEASVQVAFERSSAPYVRTKQINFPSSEPKLDQTPEVAEVAVSNISATDIQGALLPLVAGVRGGIPATEDSVLRRTVPTALGRGSVFEASLLPVYAPPEALALRPTKRPPGVLGIAATAAISVFAPQDVPEDQLAQLSASLANEGFQLDAFARVDFGISETNVRFYHREDEAVAVALAEQLGAKVRDFTSRDKLPAVGRVELWVAGGSAKIVRPPAASKPKKSKSSRQKATENLRLQVISKLKEASSQ